MSLTSALTTAVNAEPTITATARSMTLPRAMNVPNPLNVLSSFALSAQRGVRRLALPFRRRRRGGTGRRTGTFLL
jgi:hypothetical protein